ncbi:hypothetical protein [Roseovarius sp. MMSF_3281]|uniref:hypothetical protein n=1 Tax=Roseovarius sp. MMSF_3281 TaxID=3046694 RepID=UPI00273E0AB4|nr:hypothetical protein [Roseovarius sp. MMSF_3281]
MTDAEKVKHLRAALLRIATPEAFYVATAHVDPETFARMVYAEAILDGLVLERAEQKAKFETRRRYPLPRDSEGTQQ